MLKAPFSQARIAKKVFSSLPPGVSIKVEKGPKKRSKSVFGDFFRHFSDTPGGAAREDLFETFGGFQSSGGGDSCKWGLQLHVKSHAGSLVIRGTGPVCWRAATLLAD